MTSLEIEILTKIYSRHKSSSSQQGDAFLSALSFSLFQGFVSTYWKENCIFFCISGFLLYSTFKYMSVLFSRKKPFDFPSICYRQHCNKEGLETLDQMHFTTPAIHSALKSQDKKLKFSSK